MPGAKHTICREVLFEFTPIGPQVRVAALDAATGTEVVVVGPSTATQDQLERLAFRKLERKMRAERDGSSRSYGQRTGKGGISA
ncbi:MAG: hypothetical protein AAGF59_15975 [Pseudomonadota bacterium]